MTAAADLVRLNGESIEASIDAAAGWIRRTVPLAPAAVLAEGPAAAAMARRLLQRTDEELSRLRGVSAPGLILLEGDDLPWVDGVTWLGRDEAAAGLLVPTLLEPPFSIALLQRSLASKPGAAGGPLAVLPGASPRLIPLGLSRPLHRDKLLALVAA